MNIFNRPVTERQGNNCFRFPRELPAIKIGSHDGGVYLETSMNPLSEPHRYRKLLGLPPEGTSVVWAFPYKWPAT